MAALGRSLPRFTGPTPCIPRARPSSKLWSSKRFGFSCALKIIWRSVYSYHNFRCGIFYITGKTSCHVISLGSHDFLKFQAFYPHLVLKWASNSCSWRQWILVHHVMVKRKRLLCSPVWLQPLLAAYLGQGHCLTKLTFLL